MDLLDDVVFELSLLLTLGGSGVESGSVDVGVSNVNGVSLNAGLLFELYLLYISRSFEILFELTASRYSFCAFNFSKSGKKSRWMILPSSYKDT